MYPDLCLQATVGHWQAWEGEGAAYLKSEQALQFKM